MFFNIDCYIIAIYEKKIKIRITDKESLEKFIKNINNLYKTKKGKEVTDKKEIDIENIQNTFYLNISKKTKFNINGYNYINLHDLVGVNVKISGESRYYSFAIENNNEQIYKTGYSLVCNKVYT